MILAYRRFVQSVRVGPGISVFKVIQAVLKHSGLRQWSGYPV